MTLRTLYTSLLIIFITSVTHAQGLDSIKVELDRIFIESITIRKDVGKIISKYGFESKQMDSLNAEITHFDSISLKRVQTIIDTHGWLGKADVGEMANDALFLTIQHASDSAIRQKYYPLLEQSAKNGESDLSDMATMKDRLLVGSGQEQLYGTQSHLVDGELVRYPIQDPENLNKRRKKVGLGKIKL